MLNFLTRHSKLFYIIFGVLNGALIIGACFYATNYAHIHVFYQLNANGARSVTADTTNSIGYSNTMLYSFFSAGKATGYSSNFNDYVDTVFLFQDYLNGFNTAFVAWEFACLVCFAFLLVLDNHRRRIYYLSNLIGGILIPLAILFVNVGLLVNNLALMGLFNSHSELYNVVSVLQNPSVNYLAEQRANLDAIKEWFDCNSFTFILFTVFFIIIIVYSALVALYSIFKYKATAEERKKILDKVVTE